MKKQAFSIVAILLISVVAFSVLATGVVKVSTAAPKQLWTFTAKFICNQNFAGALGGGGILTSDLFNHATRIGLLPGVYTTDINVLNPSNTVTLTLQKHFVRSENESAQNSAIVTVDKTTTLGPGGALSITCFEIGVLLGLVNPTSFGGLVSLQGFVTITTDTQSLNVVAEYMTAVPDPSVSSPSLEIVPIPAVAAVP